MIWLIRARSGDATRSLFDCNRHRWIPRTRLILYFALLLLMPGLAAAQSQSLMTHHVREVTLNGEARSVGRLPAKQSMRLVLTLPLRHQPEIENFIDELYDPSSPSYRHFLSVEEFTARFGPSQEDYDAVIHFAEANGLAVVGTSRNRLNVDVKGPVADIEKAFHRDHGSLPASHGKPHILRSRSRTHGRSAVPALAHLGFG